MPQLPHHWPWILAGVWYGGLNLITAVVFAWDKRAAARGARRVRERTLLGLVWLGGFVGGWAAMRAVRHKTRKWMFRAAPWAAGVVHIGVWASLLWACRGG